MKSLTTLFSLLATITMFAQTPIPVWTYSLGDSTDFTEGRCIAVDDQGNKYSMGRFNSEIDVDPSTSEYNLTPDIMGFEEAYIQKLDPLGQLVWAYSFGRNIDADDIYIDENNDLLIGGSFYNTADFDPQIGIQEHTSQGYSDVFLLKLSASGTYQWSEVFGGTGSDDFFDLQMVNGALFLHSGISSNGLTTTSAQYACDLNIQKLEASGNMLWTRTFECTGRAGASIHVDSDENIYVGGTFSKEIDCDPGIGSAILSSSNIASPRFDMFYMKLDATGNLLWNHRLGSSEDDFSTQLVVDQNGNVFGAGMYEGVMDFNPSSNSVVLTPSGRDVFTIKFDADGNYQWVKSSVAPGDQSLNNMVIDANGELIQAGYFSGIFDLDDSSEDYHVSALGFAQQVYVRKLDADGNFVWGYQTEGDRSAVPMDLKLTTSGNIVVTGEFNGDFDLDVNDPSNEVYYAELVHTFILELSGDQFSGFLEDEIEEMYVSLFPNPSNGNWVNITSDTALESVSIYSTSGKMVFQTEDLGDEMLILPQLTSGAYLVQVLGENTAKTIRLIVE